MIKAIITFVLIPFATTTTFAQEIEYNVLYDSNKSVLTEAFKAELRKLLGETPNETFSQIALFGHTDSDASEEYNLNLSQERVQGVKDFLINLNISDTIISSSFSGESEPRESNATPKGKQANRRVQIKLLRKPTVAEMEVVLGEKKPNPCAKDTIIRLETGGHYQINRCTYLENPNCVQLKEVGTAQSMAESGLNTMNEDGEALISAGMVEYDICEGTEVTYFLPIRQGCDPGGMTLWQLNEDGLWHETSPEELEPIEVNGQTFYKLRLAGRGTKNCDTPPKKQRKLPTRKSRFKFKRKSGMSVQSVTIYCDCPLRGQRITSKRNKGKKAVYEHEHVKNRCCSDARVMIEAKNADGKIVYMRQRLLTELEGNTFMGDCPTTERRKFLFLRIRNKSMYRKYRLRKEDFVEELN